MYVIVLQIVGLEVLKSRGQYGGAGEKLKKCELATGDNQDHCYRDDREACKLRSCQNVLRWQQNLWIDVVKPVE